MSRTRTLSLALLAILLSRSLRSLSSSDKASSVLLGSQHHRVSQGGAPGGGRCCRAGSAPAVRWKRPKRPSFCKANCCGCCWGGPGCGGCLSPLQLWEVLPARGGGCGCSGDSCTPCTTLTAVLSAKVGGCWARLGPKTLGFIPQDDAQTPICAFAAKYPNKGFVPQPSDECGERQGGGQAPHGHLQVHRTRLIPQSPNPQQPGKGNFLLQAGMGAWESSCRRQHRRVPRAAPCWQHRTPWHRRSPATPTVLYRRPSPPEQKFSPERPYLRSWVPALSLSCPLLTVTVLGWHSHCLSSSRDGRAATPPPATPAVTPPLLAADAADSDTPQLGCSCPPVVLLEHRRATCCPLRMHSATMPQPGVTRCHHGSLQHLDPLLLLPVPSATNHSTKSPGGHAGTPRHGGMWGRLCSIPEQ